MPEVVVAFDGEQGVVGRRPSGYRARIRVLEFGLRIRCSLAQTFGDTADVAGTAEWPIVEAELLRGAVADVYVVASDLGENESLNYGSVISRFAPMRVLWTGRSISERSGRAACELGLIPTLDPPAEGLVRRILESRWRLGRRTASQACALVCENLAEELYLTEREQDVVRCLLSGMDAADIADELQISQRTVQVHVGHILKKARIPKTQLFVVEALQRALRIVCHNETQAL